MNKIILIFVSNFIFFGCKAIQSDSTHYSTTFNPKLTQDSLWLFTPLIKFADYSNSFDAIAKSELDSILNYKLLNKNELRSRYLIEQLNIKEIDSYFKSLRKTPVEYWLVYTISIDKNDPFEKAQTKTNNEIEPLIAYLRIFKVSSGKQIYHQEIIYTGNSSDDDNPYFIPFREKYYQKLLERALKVLKKDMVKPVE